MTNLGVASPNPVSPEGVLLVQNGATVTTGAINLGVTNGGGGALNITGGSVVNYSALNATGPNVYVNFDSPLYVGGGSSLLGEANGGGDTLDIDATVDGSGSIWEPKAGLTVSSGTLKISGGGQFNTIDSGLEATGAARLSVAGAASTVVVGGFSTLDGSSSLAISNGGALRAMGGLLDASSLTVQDNGSLNVAGQGLRLEA